MSVTVLTVVGARPQFVKAAPLSRRLRERYREVLVHTGQHYDEEMSGAFFSELGIPEPDENLSVGSGPHGPQTRAMREGLAGVIAKVRPQLVLTYGDTNSTLAGSIAAAEAGVALAHVEAGLRSFNLEMPEEVNRIAADHLSDLCLGPTAAAMENLDAEGLSDRARLVGDVMLDACLAAKESVGDAPLVRFGVAAGEYAFATVHRAENTDHSTRLAGILSGLGEAGMRVIFAVHPRTRGALERLEIPLPENVTAVPPVGYGETMALVANAARIFTDSGGLQKEAYFLGTPCVTLREETEWTETVAGGWNVLAGSDPARIREAASAPRPTSSPRDLEQYGGGRACERIVAAIEALLSI